MVSLARGLQRLCDVGMVSQVMAGVLQRTRLCGEILVDWGKYTKAVGRIISQLRMLAASLAATHAELACLRCVRAVCAVALPYRHFLTHCVQLLLLRAEMTKACGSTSIVPPSNRPSIVLEQQIVSVDKCSVISEVRPTCGPHGVCGVELRTVCGVYNSYPDFRHQRTERVEPFQCVQTLCWRCLAYHSHALLLCVSSLAGSASLPDVWAKDSQGEWTVQCLDDESIVLGDVRWVARVCGCATLLRLTRECGLDVVRPGTCH